MSGNCSATLTLWFNQLSSSWSSSRERARCTTRASMNNQVAWKYFSLSISRHKCSGASRSNFMWAESTCNVCRCESSLPTVDVGCCLYGCCRDAMASLVSWNASCTRFADFAMEIMDVEACRRSRYRSPTITRSSSCLASASDLS